MYNNQLPSAELNNIAVKSCGCRVGVNECCDTCQNVIGNEKDIVENPKDSIGDTKMPIHLFPQAAIYMGSLGNLDGALKYGRNNWRAADIRYTVYLNAIKRHCDALLECEDEDPDSGLHHLCHVLAGAGILADAMASDKLVDDRNYVPKKGAWRRFVNTLTPHVARLREKHKDKDVKHWTAKNNDK